MTYSRILNVITSNKGKYAEYSDYLENTRMLNPGYHEIQADTLEEVVEHAMDSLSEYAPLIIDDSGLFIHVLKDFPGVYSAYVMRTLGYHGILKLMEGVNDRTARFECVIGYMDEDGITRLFKGESRGRISHVPRGDSGFGYDPIFIPEGCDNTFGEMSISEKTVISHRGRAVEEFLLFHNTMR